MPQARTEADRTPNRFPAARRNCATPSRAKLVYALAKTPEQASEHDWYQATVMALRDRLVDVWMAERDDTKRRHKKRVYYLSIEFLIGRLLFDTLNNMRLTETTRRALAALGVDLDALREVEPDAALGNGGLGRLAACFMDSMAALGIPAYGYGIRYENGLFEQRIEDGWQHEFPEEWLANGNPWEFANRETNYAIGFGGVVEYLGGDEATARAIWYPAETVLAVPHDTLIAGWRARHVNVLRLWQARAPSPLQLSALNHGDLVGATAARARAEAISRVLYPNDATPEGQELRLRQEYFFTAASLQDLIRRQLDEYGTLDALPEHAAVQLNDTHPAIAVAELMRLLVDEHNFGWEHAWRITRATLAYTNHTLLPEALESWPVELFGRLLPRHLQIIYLINWAAFAGGRECRPHGSGFPGQYLAGARERRQMRAHGASGLRRLACRQRRLGAAHRFAAQDLVSRPRAVDADAHRQRDQRHHLPALAHRRQPPAHRPADAHAGRARARRPRGAARSRSVRRRRQVCRALPQRARAQQGAARRPAAPAHRRAAAGGRAVRRAHQARARI